MENVGRVRSAVQDSVNFVVDMSLPPSWVSVLQNAGWCAVHWSHVGNASASDSEVMQYAAERHLVVLTHDLDFAVLLALSSATGPSVIQLRSERVLPRFIGEAVKSAIKQFEVEITRGALVTIDPDRARVRILPIRQGG